MEGWIKIPREAIQELDGSPEDASDDVQGFISDENDRPNAVAKVLDGELYVRVNRALLRRVADPSI